ncbi:MAG: hypothetical protein M3Y32_09815 [Pseudomonadota bacterium]|nr:hypothetical protein [Pseudomonadota bacterium]
MPDLGIDALVARLKPGARRAVSILVVLLCLLYANIAISIASSVRNRDLIAQGLTRCGPPLKRSMPSACSKKLLGSASAYPA